MIEYAIKKLLEEVGIANPLIGSYQNQTDVVVINKVGGKSPTRILGEKMPLFSNHQIRIDIVYRNYEDSQKISSIISKKLESYCDFVRTDYGDFNIKDINQISEPQSLGRDLKTNQWVTNNFIVRIQN